MSFLYPKGIDETPNCVLQAFDIITNVIDKDEIDKSKALKEKNNKSSKQVRGPG